MNQKNPPIIKERRKYTRSNVQIWTVEKNDNFSSFHLLTNLSAGGFFIEKKLPFQIGSIVNLELELNGEILSLCGKIVNNYKNPTSNHSGSGVHFVDMDENAKAKIEEYLTDL